MTFKKILVAIDGSENSEKVLDSVSGIASALGAELALLAVTGSHSRFNGAGAAEANGDEQQDAEGYLRRLADRLAAQGLSVTTTVKSGIPTAEILATADELGSDLIAMATHRGSALARGILGSVTDTVLRKSGIPVLAINPDGTNIAGGAGWKPATVIVPLDGSSLAEKSVPVAIELARVCGADMVFTQAVHLPTYAVSGPGAEYYGADYGVSAEREGAREYLAQFVEIAKSSGVEARSHAALGNAAGRIIEESANVPDAMIVICSHGRSGFQRMILGSVADKIVRASHHPVLVLKASEED